MAWENKTVRDDDLDLTITYTREHLRDQRYIYLANIAFGKDHRFVLSDASSEGLFDLIHRVLPVAYYARFLKPPPVETLDKRQSQEAKVCHQREVNT